MQTYPVCCSCSCGGCRKPQNGVENSIEVNFTSENLLLKTQADLLKKTTCVGCIKLLFFLFSYKKTCFHTVLSYIAHTSCGSRAFVATGSISLDF